MENLADHLLQAGVMEVIGTRIDQVALRMSGSLSLLHHCYRDEAGKSALAAQLIANPSIKRALAYLEKLLVLAPKNEGVYSPLRTIYRFTDQATALHTLHQRFLAAQFDPLRDRDERAKNIAGTNDQRYRKSTEVRIRFLEELLASKTLTRPSTTAAVAMTELVDNRANAAYYGADLDIAAQVALAEQAEAEAPSADSRTTLITTLLCQALIRVSASTPALATLAAENHRTLSDATLAILACADPHIGPGLAADPALTRAISLIKDRLLALPQHPSSGYWALLHAVGDAAATDYAEALRHDEAGTTALLLDLDLNPLRASDVVEVWWRHLALADTTAAAAVLTLAHQREVNLPALVH